MLWHQQGVEEATWEHEDMIHAYYPFLFEDDGTLFNHLVVMTDVFACDYVYMCVNFGDKILLRGEECENAGKFELFQIKDRNSGSLLRYKLKT